VRTIQNKNAFIFIVERQYLLAKRKGTNKWWKYKEKHKVLPIFLFYPYFFVPLHPDFRLFLEKV